MGSGFALCIALAASAAFSAPSPRHADSLLARADDWQAAPVPFRPGSDSQTAPSEPAAPAGTGSMHCAAGDNASSCMRN
jgi:hypothetical protein